MKSACDSAMAGPGAIGRPLESQTQPLGAFLWPVPSQAHGPEQIPLDHEAVEAPDALLQVDPVQHQMVLDRGAQVVRHSAVEAVASSRECTDRSSYGCRTGL